MTVLLTNNAKTVLSGVLSPADTIIPLRAGTGVRFPQPVEPDDWFPLAITDVDGNVEYLRAVSRMGDAIRVLRGQEGTQPRAYNPGDIVDLRLTAAAVADMCACGEKPEPSIPTLSVSDTTVQAEPTSPDPTPDPDPDPDPEPPEDYELAFLDLSDPAFAWTARGVSQAPPIDIPSAFTGGSGRVECAFPESGDLADAIVRFNIDIVVDVTYADAANIGSPLLTIEDRNGVEVMRVTPFDGAPYPVRYLSGAYFFADSGKRGSLAGGKLIIRDEAASASAARVTIETATLIVGVQR